MQTQTKNRKKAKRISVLSDCRGIINETAISEQKLLSIGDGALVELVWEGQATHWLQLNKQKVIFN